MTMLDELLGLKVFREGKAEMEVSGSRGALREAEEERDRANTSLADYRSWAIQRERDMYDEVCRRIVVARDLERLREDVSGLKHKEHELQGLADQTEKQRALAEEALRAARQKHELAVRSREKFVQLTLAEAEELRLESERKEDVETEDQYALRREADTEEPDDE